MGLFGKSHHKTTAEVANIKDVKLVEKERVIEKEAIVNTIVDKPILDQVVEKKNVEVHHKNVVQEIHEQPIVEIERLPQTRIIKEATEVKTVIDHQKMFENINAGAELSFEEKERLFAAKQGKLSLPTNVEVTKDVKVDTLQDKEEVREIIIQPMIERHQQALVTEIHDKKVIEVHEHPVVRKIIEKPIIREIIHEQTSKAL
jgi:trehalose/maltose hydrolase-like predicted phosphorylase